MTVLERMKLRIPEEPDEAVFLDCIESARAAILKRRFPFGATDKDKDAYMEDEQNLLYLCATDLYNRSGSEGQLSHVENSVSRQYESAWISESLLSSIVPMVKTL